uniref:AP complex subunit sigma n=1 Tax=Steinernema glaseri TaxID=37863 RepID=A0A1I7ZLD8_9BILA
MIKAILVFNNSGIPRFLKFYKHYSEAEQQHILKTTYDLVSLRRTDEPYFLDASPLMGPDSQLVYRHYVTLYFVFCVDSAENELVVLDMIKLFVETLDKQFECVRELDLIFHCDKVNEILNEFVQGGLIAEVDGRNILHHVREQEKIKQQENSTSAKAIRTLGTINFNISRPFKQLGLPDFTQFANDMDKL